MKKNISLILILLILVSQFAVFAITPTDIQNHWAKSDIDDLVNRKIVNGYNDGSFRPNNNISIEEFIKLVVVTMNNNVQPSKTGKWSDPYIAKAIETNLIREKEFVNYILPITREEMAFIIINALKQKGDGYDNLSLTSYIVDDVFDIFQTNDDYYNSVIMAFRTGLITGYTIDKNVQNVTQRFNFRPKGNATRAEAVTVLMRLIEPSRRVAYTPPSTEVSSNRSIIYPVLRGDGADAYYEDDMVYLQPWKGKYYDEAIQVAKIIKESALEQQKLNNINSFAYSNTENQFGVAWSMFEDEMIDQYTMEQIMYAIIGSIDVDNLYFGGKSKPYSIHISPTDNNLYGIPNYKTFEYELNRMKPTIDPIFDFLFESQSEKQRIYSMINDRINDPVMPVINTVVNGRNVAFYSDTTQIVIDISTQDYQTNLK